MGSGPKGLKSVAQDMVAPGKGILAADESSPTLTKRFTALGIESTPDSRRSWREMLFTSPSLSNWISGVILYDETFRQQSSRGVLFPEMLKDLELIPGIKVDTGTKPLAGCPGELITEGLDGLAARVAEYRSLGARFAKWRAVITISDKTPTRVAVVTNAHSLARYAKICQSEDLVPIVEPEVLMDGDHSIERCYEVTCNVLEETFSALHLFDVDFESMVLKPSMVVSGKDSPLQADEEMVGAMSVECYKDNVPASVAGIALLSGGQSDEKAAAHLNAMAKLGPYPWPITFSYGRALQDLPMKVWLGRPENDALAQQALLERAEAYSKAQRGLSASS